MVTDTDNIVVWSDSGVKMPCRCKSKTNQNNRSQNSNLN